MWQEIIFLLNSIATFAYFGVFALSRGWFAQYGIEGFPVLFFWLPVITFVAFASTILSVILSFVFAKKMPPGTPWHTWTFLLAVIGFFLALSGVGNILGLRQTEF